MRRTVYGFAAIIWPTILSAYASRQSLPSAPRLDKGLFLEALEKGLLTGDNKHFTFIYPTLYAIWRHEVGSEK